MELKDVFISRNWERRADETDDAYEVRYVEMSRMFLDDYNTNGEIVIINGGFPLCKSMLIRARKYIDSVSEFRSKIIEKLITDIREMHSDSQDKIKEEINASIAGQQIHLIREKTHRDWAMNKEIRRIEYCKCALCLDTTWVNIIYPLYFKEKYFANGFIDKGGHSGCKCPACLYFGTKDRQYDKPKRNLLAEDD